MTRERWLWTLGLVGAVLIGLVAGPPPAAAQTPVPNPAPATTKLAWTHDGVDITSWQVQIDSTAPVVVTPTKLGAEWTIPFPALTPGAHALKVAACRAIPNFPDACGWSDPLAVISIVVSSPTGVRVVPLGGGS